MYVFIRMAIYAMSRDFHQLSFLTKHQSVRRTGLHASGFFPFLQPFVAHVALHDSRIPAGILEFWNVKGAGDHAESAAHAFVAVPCYRSLFGLEHRVYQTGGCASGLPAVHALLLDKHFAFFRIEAIYNRELFFARIPNILKRIVTCNVRYIIVVPLRTCHLARSAAYASGRIGQHSDEFSGFFRIVGFDIDVGYASRTKGGRGYQKLSSVHDFSHLKTDR
jgi:hypothetical protein